jgi:hypothetical protein
MWRHADSAFAVMMEFAASPEADSLDVFEGHYCQVLIAELLFKNDYGQSNREEVLKAVHYFDSIVGMDGADTRGKSDARGASLQRFGPQSRNLGSVIRGIKSAVTHLANEKQISFAWQTRYHDHIIRSQEEMNNIAEYIEHNPAKWETDCFFNE